MADSKISALTNHAAAPAAGDLFVIVDVSDTTMAASGTDKKLAASYLLNSAGTQTGATSQAQTFTSGIISNGQVGINRTPTTALDVYHATSHSLVTIATASTTANITAGFTVSADAVTTSLRAYTAASGGGSRLNFTVSGGYLLLGTLSADPVNIYAGNAARIVVGATGLTSIGHSATGTAYADVAASTTSAASLRLRSGSAPTTANDGDIWNDGALSYYGANSTTNAVVNHLRLRRDSTGTAAAGFGLGIIAELESSTTNAQSAGRLTWEWATATHASRAAAGKLTAYYTSTERTAITWTANSSNVTINMNANDITNAATIASLSQTIAPASTGVEGLVINMPTSTTFQALKINYNGTQRQQAFADAVTNRYWILSTDGGTGTGPYVQIGRNNNGSTPAAGFVSIEDRGGQPYYIWPDDSGDLRIFAAATVHGADTAGTVIGTQTSSLASKNVLGEFTDYGAALQAIVDAPLHNFTYKSGSYNGEQFTGIITDHAPVFGMDRDAAHPAGKSLNAITAHGYTMAAIKELNRKIEMLQDLVARLTQSN